MGPRARMWFIDGTAQANPFPPAGVREIGSALSLPTGAVATPAAEFPAF